MTPFLTSQLKSQEYSRTVWDIKDAPADTSVESLLKPETWRLAAAKLTIYDEIIVIPQGGPYRAHLIVMDKGKAFAKVRLLGVTLLNATANEYPEVPVEVIAVSELPDDAPVLVKWNGPKDKFTVLRRSDNEKLRTGFAIKTEATAWAHQHITAMAA